MINLMFECDEVIIMLRQCLGPVYMVTISVYSRAPTLRGNQ